MVIRQTKEKERTVYKCSDYLWRFVARVSRHYRNATEADPGEIAENYKDSYHVIESLKVHGMIKTFYTVEESTRLFL